MRQVEGKRDHEEWKLRGMRMRWRIGVREDNRERRRKWMSRNGKSL